MGPRYAADSHALGIDLTGATNPSAATVQWTPRTYSHLRYTQLAKTVLTQSNAITVFVRMQGKGGDWHLYGMDDCVLTHEDVPLHFGPSAALTSSNRFQMTLYGKAHSTNQIEVSTNLTSWRPLGSVVNQQNRSNSARSASQILRCVFSARGRGKNFVCKNFAKAYDGRQLFETSQLLSGNPVEIGDGCATVTGYKLPPCHWSRRCGTGKAGARLGPKSGYRFSCARLGSARAEPTSPSKRRMRPDHSVSAEWNR